MSHPDGTGERTTRLRRVMGLLDEAYGDQTWHWHPHYVRGPIDVLAGAVLVQHTAWPNAERALEALRHAGALDIDALAVMPEERIAELVRASGTPSVKAKRLRALAQTVQACGGLAAFLALPADQMRERLLATHGVGPETADAIALYAAGRRVFVVDAYTQRTFRRLGLVPEGDGYETWREWFEAALPDAGATSFQRYHAAIVLHAKARCRSRPLCDGCPLAAMCAHLARGASTESRETAARSAARSGGSRRGPGRGRARGIPASPGAG